MKDMKDMKEGLCHTLLICTGIPVPPTVKTLVNTAFEEQHQPPDDIPSGVEGQNEKSNPEATE